MMRLSSGGSTLRVWIVDENLVSPDIAASTASVSSSVLLSITGLCEEMIEKHFSMNRSSNS